MLDEECVPADPLESSEEQIDVKLWLVEVFVAVKVDKPPAAAVELIEMDSMAEVTGFSVSKKLTEAYASGLPIGREVSLAPRKDEVVQNQVNRMTCR